MHVLPRRALVAELRHGLRAREPTLALKDGLPQLEKVLGRRLFRAGDVVVDGRVDRVKLPALLGVREDLHRFRDALEERVVVRQATGTGLLVRVVTEDLAPVSLLDLLVRSLVAQVLQAQDLVVVLLLPLLGVKAERRTALSLATEALLVIVVRRVRPCAGSLELIERCSLGRIIVRERASVNDTARVRRERRACCEYAEITARSCTVTVNPSLSFSSRWTWAAGGRILCTVQGAHRRGATPPKREKRLTGQGIAAGRLVRGPCDGQLDAGRIHGRRDRNGGHDGRCLLVAEQENLCLFAGKK